MREAPVTTHLIKKYLAQNKALGLGKGWTVGTFLTRTLGGKAKDFQQSYWWRMTERLENMNGVIRHRSARGGVAYYPDK